MKLELPPLPPPHDGRCEICGWELAESVADGCVPGNCSFRPADHSPEWVMARSKREAAERRADQMRAYARTAVLLALEAAAQIADDMDYGCPPAIGAAIRRLSENRG